MKLILINLGLISENDSPTYAHWKRIGFYHHHGICLPLFSLRSTKSCGIGEFPDLLPLLPWLKMLGYDVLQLLPLQDPGNQESPYSAISAFALNPLFLGLSRLPRTENLDEFKTLNALPLINYPKLRGLKNRFLKRYYRKEGKRVVQTESFHSFVHENPWLKGYAQFKKEDFEYCGFIQFLCFEQLKEVQRKAQEVGVLLKGDIPILISRKSADVEERPHLFFTHLSAGAPPDMFNPEGQNWNFPLYNWAEMEKEDYRWWKERLDHSGRFFDLYRLDHIVGFYRIYEAKEKKFHPENENEWIPQGEKILKVLLRHSPMLPIGEDLGCVPPFIKNHLASLGICGTKVIRWERELEKPFSYIPYDRYPILSMTTVSTHDTSTLPEWLRGEEAEAFASFKGWKKEDSLDPAQLFEILWDSHHTPSLFHINLFQEYLALVEGMTWGKDRINIPGVKTNRNWAYRFRPLIEEIVSNLRLAEVLKACVS